MSPNAGLRGDWQLAQPLLCTGSWKHIFNPHSEVLMVVPGWYMLCSTQKWDVAKGEGEEGVTS